MWAYLACGQPVTFICGACAAWPVVGLSPVGACLGPMIGLVYIGGRCWRLRLPGWCGSSLWQQEALTPSLASQHRNEMHRKREHLILDNCRIVLAKGTIVLDWAVPPYQCSKVLSRQPCETDRSCLLEIGNSLASSQLRYYCSLGHQSAPRAGLEGLLVFAQAWRSTD